MWVEVVASTLADAAVITSPRTARAPQCTRNQRAHHPHIRNCARTLTHSTDHRDAPGRGAIWLALRFRCGGAAELSLSAHATLWRSSRNRKLVGQQTTARRVRIRGLAAVLKDTIRRSRSLTVRNPGHSPAGTLKGSNRPFATACRPDATTVGYRLTVDIWRALNKNPGPHS